MSGSVSSSGDVESNLAAAFVAACAAEGHRPHTGLRLLAGGRAERPASVPVADPWGLGEAHQSLTTPSDRKARGAWYTPRHLAVELVERTVVDAGAVVDPSCGGGVFLLAAADRLVTLGAPPAAIVGDLVIGIDVDPLAVAVAEAALWWWGARHGVDVLPGRLSIGDALVGDRLPRCSAVVGNPPFLGQLKGGTVVDGEYRARLRQRFGDAVGAYTDPAGLFLLAGVEAVGPGGRVTLIQPQSVLATRDTVRLRRRLDESAEFESCWFDAGSTFAASVDVCAPTLRRVDHAPPRPRRWADALADHRGVPAVELAGSDTLGHIATVRAGFRDEYYGLVDAVREGGTGPRLVTSGAIDPLTLRSDRPTSFAKRTFDDPRIDVDRAADRARAWVAAQRVPSVLIASQTKILECLADPDGHLVVGVPGLVVIPGDPDDLWRIAAALSAPCVSAWLLRQTVGTGLSGDACRPTAPLLTGLPLPADVDAWNDAAQHVRLLASGGEDLETWRAFAQRADAAYGVVDAGVADWWDRRRPRR